MLSLKTSQLNSVPIRSLLVCGYLVLLSQYNPAQAQIPKNGFSIAQLLPSFEIPISQDPLPQSQPLEPVEFSQDQNNQYNQYSQPAPITQISQNLGKYFVYVNSSNSQTLLRIRQIEKTAYIRQYNGQKIIQAGTFTRLSNAEQRVRELQLKGINGAGVANANTQVVPFNSGVPYNSGIPYNSGGEISYYSPATNFNNASSNVRQKQSNFYYAIIPSSYENLSFIGRELQQKIRGNTTILMRTEPRGAHIAVGPFAERSTAEQWNNYLRDLGYGNTRVYYGK